jgi:hypothetical protein
MFFTTASIMHTVVLLFSTPFSLAIALICCALTFVGCAFGHKETTLLDPVPVAGPSAKIAILRINQFCGFHPLNYVVVDERAIVALETGQHTAFNLSPGRHNIGVYHHGIDNFSIFFPGGVSYARYEASSITEDFLAGQSYQYLLSSNCVPLDETKRVEIEKIENWPEDLPMDSKQFVRPGKDGATQSAH